MSCFTIPLPGRGPAASALGGLISLVLLCLLSAPARADETELSSGTLMLAAAGGTESDQAVRLGTDIDAQVSGQIARVKVVQAFRNPSKAWVEATYLYPLPEDGAVDSLKMVVGDRVVIGEIKPRAEARTLYEQARDSGARAGLVEQQRPNLFTTAVANVGPGQTVLIEIEYQTPIRSTAGLYSLRLPLAVTPRYAPDATVASDPVPNRAAILRPMPSAGRPSNPVSIVIHLQPGFPLGDLLSRYHLVDVRPEGDGGRVIKLAGGQTPADRDFVLDWRSAAVAPALAAFHSRVAGDDYVMAVVTPPAQARYSATPPQPRELVFVIDNSGSMGGQSMVQAKQSLAYALKTLRPQDRFNVIRFDDSLTVLFPSPVAATEGNVRRASDYVAGLQAQGGTEMLPALEAALVDPTPEDASHLRQVIFLTDGAIGDEERLMAELAAHLGRSRVFMVGIGSAPNTFLMSRAAEIGRGGFTHIGATDEVETVMRGLIDRLTKPVATQLKAELVGLEGELTPALIPDLYDGEPLVITAKTHGGHGRLRISGLVDNKPWSTETDLGKAPEAVGVSKLWARRKIADAEVARTLGTLSQEDADASVLALGMAHKMVTSQTSLVAIDHTPARPAGVRLTREDLPLDLPPGWDFDALFGAQTSDSPRSTADAGEEAGQPIDLPQTATDAELRLLIGLALCLAAGGGLVLVRGRRRGETA